MARSKQENCANRLKSLNSLLISRLAYHDFLARDVYGMCYRSSSLGQRRARKKSAAEKQPHPPKQEESKSLKPRGLPLSSLSAAASLGPEQKDVTRCVPLHLSARPSAAARTISPTSPVSKSSTRSLPTPTSARPWSASRPTSRRPPLMLKKPLRKDLVRPEIQAIMRDPYLPFRSESSGRSVSRSSAASKGKESRADVRCTSLTDDTSAEDEASREDWDQPGASGRGSQVSSREDKHITFHQLILASALNLLGAFPNGGLDQKVSTHRLPSFWEIL